MVKVEVCIDSDSSQAVGNSVGLATLAGASTIELCSAMEVGGLTPDSGHIKEANQFFRDQKGLMVMIRPRKGDFYYSDTELLVMQNQIEIAALAGADGVVLGVLGEEDNCVAIDSLHELMETSRRHHLNVTFHRAFDATPDPLETLELLIDAGVDRLLTSGTPWGSRRTAVDGIETLAKIAEKAAGRIEIVIGGGINSGNVGTILDALPLEENNITVHAYSSVLEDGLVRVQTVKPLVDSVKKTCA